MSNLQPISRLPTRYEPLVRTFGDRAKSTFVRVDADLTLFKRLVAQVQSAQQGKIQFIAAEPGTGKSTFVHSLEVFMNDEIAQVQRLPEPYELPLSGVPTYLARLPVRPNKITVVNFDVREAPVFDEGEYRTVLGQVNGLLRSRPDLLIVWPVNDREFAQKIVSLLQLAGGQSALGQDPVYDLRGLERDQWAAVLDKILQIANWRLEDAAIDANEIGRLVASEKSVGDFLDKVQRLIAQRFDVDQMGLVFPKLIIAISSGLFSNREGSVREPSIRETCRNLRRADSFYLEASRLLMYTKKSNVAEWWNNRATDLKSALPHVIALFTAQLVSISASAVVHSILQHGSDELKALVTGVQANRANAIKVITSSELFKIITGEGADNREYGSNVKDETIESYHRIQAVSKTSHQQINRAVLAMLQEAGASLPALAFDVDIRPGLIADVIIEPGHERLALELHHKHGDESTPNKIAIYVLEKLQEYAINYGLASR